MQAAVLLYAVTLLLLYAPVLRKLVSDWSEDENYSHGFLIVPLALYFAWERRGRLARETATPSPVGLAVIAGSLCVLVAGQLGAELFLTRISLIGVLTGTVLFLGGWGVLRVLTLPLGFLLLMIPLPTIVFNQIAFPLQLLASRVGAASLSAAEIPVLREGNLITLAHTTLEVAEACSGIRSLISLLTLGIVYGYFLDQRMWVRWTVALSTIPIAIASNAARIAGTGIAAHYWGAQAAEGFFHTFSGWLVFVAAFAMLFTVSHLLLRVAPGVPKGAPPAEAWAG